MRRLLLVLALALLGLPAHADGPPAGDGGWFWQNPLPAGNMAWGIHFVSPSTGWIIGQAGLILRTDDGGATWTTQRSGTDADLLFAHFLDARNGWVLGFRSAGALEAYSVLLATRDGGATWVPQDLRTTQMMLSVHFSDPLHGWSVGYGGTMRTTSNGGLAWYGLSAGISAPLMDVYFTDPRNGWIVGGNDGDPYNGSRVFLRTTDGGIHWTGALNMPDTPLMQVQFLNPSSGWMADAKGVLQRSTDGGASWTPVPTPQPASSFQFLDAQTGWINSLPVYRTADGGGTWTSIPWSTDGGSESLALVDADHAFSLRGNLPYGTVDGGTTWRPLFPKAVTPQFWAVSFPNAREGWALVGNGSTWHTTDGGTHWTPLAKTLPGSVYAYGMSFPDTRHGWLVGAEGAIFHTGDGGATWQVQDGGVTADLRDVQAVDANHVWARGTDAFIRTADGGKTWESLPVGGRFYFVSPSVGFRVTRNLIQRTDDGGLHWTDMKTLGADYLLTEIHFLDANNGLVGGRISRKPDAPDLALLMRTRDGGATWTEERIGAEDGERVGAVRLLGPDNEWAVTDGHEYHSLDGGRTWTRRWLGVSLPFVSAAFPDPMNGWLVEMGGTILHTRTGGLLPGDVNADGQINTADATRALAVAGGLNGDPAQAALADVDGDGAVTLADVTEILRHSSLPRATLEGTLLPNDPRSIGLPFGTHILRAPDGTTTPLVSVSVDLRAFEGKTVRLRGEWLPGYPLDRWTPDRLLNVTWVVAE